jgi:RNA polymerase sigma-70 factor (ECF subfamily)
MSKAQQKVRAAIEQDRTRVLLVRAAGRILPADDSEDAALDAVVQALSHAEQFREDAQVSTWLHRIAFNAALVRQRSATRASRRLQRAQRELGITGEGGAALPPANEAVASAPHSPTRDLEESELRSQLRTAVDRLPAVYRTVVERCVYEEQSPEVVARELGITPSALRTRIMRARERLRELMAPQDDRVDGSLALYLSRA